MPNLCLLHGGFGGVFEQERGGKLMEELKSCPFCGGEAQAIEKWNNRPDNWISVEERLPGKDVLVLCFFSKMRGTEAEIQVQKGFNLSSASNLKNKIITHWQALLEPPKGSE